MESASNTNENYNKLVALGIKPNQIEKCLKRTNNNWEVVSNYLIAKKAYAEASKQFKRNKRNSSDSSDEMAIEDTKQEKKTKKSKPEKNSNASEKNEIQRIYLNTRESLPNTIRKIYLDGNNMMFVVSSLRNLVLSRKQRLVEEIMTSLARKVAEKLGSSIDQIYLIFDNGHRTLNENRLVVATARPTYATSDDALVEIAKSEKLPCIYVTSDEELKTRITSSGGFIAGPKDFFKFAADILSDGKYTNLEDFYFNFTSEYKNL